MTNTPASAARTRTGRPQAALPPAASPAARRATQRPALRGAAASPAPARASAPATPRGAAHRAPRAGVRGTVAAALSAALALAATRCMVGFGLALAAVAPGAAQARGGGDAGPTAALVRAQARGGGDAGPAAALVRAQTRGGDMETAPALAPDAALLAGGAVQVAAAASPGLPGKAFTAWTLVPAPVPRLCALVQDYPAYASYMPNTKSAQAIAAGEGYVLVDMILDLPLGQEKKYRLRLEPQSDATQCRLAWRLVPSGLPASETIADTTGYWLFKPMPGSEGGKTLVEYHVYADPGPVPWGLGWIVDMMSKRSLPRTLEALRAQAAK